MACEGHDDVGELCIGFALLAPKPFFADFLSYYIQLFIAAACAALALKAAYILVYRN